MFEDFLARAEARHEYWRQKCEAHGDFAAARAQRRASRARAGGNRPGGSGG